MSGKLDIQSNPGLGMPFGTPFQSMQGPMAQQIQRSPMSYRGPFSMASPWGGTYSGLGFTGAGAGAPGPSNQSMMGVGYGPGSDSGQKTFGTSLPFLGGMMSRSPFLNFAFKGAGTT